MNEEQNTQGNLLDTTDCLEAIGVFKGWKNFLFIIVFVCLLVIQTAFWLVSTGYVKACDAAKSDASVVTSDTAQTKKAPEQTVIVEDKITQAAKQVIAEPNQPTKEVPKQETQQPAGRFFHISFQRLAALIRFFNFVLIPVAVLYCLTMLFCLKLSLLGRLGGINHISRAFFLSLLMLVLLLPWQRFFPGIFVGAIFTPADLLCAYTAIGRDCGIFSEVLYYLRFTGYGLLVLLLLILAQLRSARWAKATLRRLEVI